MGSMLARLVNIYLFRCNNKILFGTSGFLGWLISHILFMKWLGLVLVWIRQNHSIRSKKYIRSNKYLVLELKIVNPLRPNVVNEQSPCLTNICIFSHCLPPTRRREADSRDAYLSTSKGKESVRRHFSLKNEIIAKMISLYPNDEWELTKFIREKFFCGRQKGRST